MIIIFINTIITLINRIYFRKYIPAQFIQIKTPKSILAHYGDFALQSAQNLFSCLPNNKSIIFSYSISPNRRYELIILNIL